MGKKKRKAKTIPKSKTSVTSVKSYKHGIEAEKQKMTDYIKEFNKGVERYIGEINKQIKENKESVTRIFNGTTFLISKINKKKKDFQSYAHGPFQSYIKDFWG